ncbi:uncharacterized protein LOC114951845 [Acropora millepora]|uniref:uncharacterized protein LOC114951845 n=1 Tax=Acropora millepora TaxID=45264 RepID=UPI001CF2093D|nr:uncharacterized protein LOC114951845 [Acropora millepora]
MENQLCDILKNINASANFGRGLGVSFPIFDGSENEDVFEFLDKFKRAATLNSWNDDDLPIGLPLYLKGHASAWFKCLQGANEMTFDELSTAMINHFASRATQWRIRQALSQLRQLEKESVADYSHNVRNLCARLSLPRSEWTYYFIQGLRPEIRDYVILQQANHLDEAENFAQLKEFVLASCDETPTSKTQQLSAQVIEKLPATARSEDKTIGAFDSQQNDSDESGEMRRVIREELRQIVSEEPRHFGCFSRQFRNHRNFGCFDCSRNGHTQCYCTADTNSKRHYVSNSEKTDQPLVINESYYRNTNQGNGLAPLSR